LICIPLYRYGLGMVPRRLTRFLPLAAVVLCLAAVLGVFFSRPPVLFVTDPSFNVLYGNLRARLKQAEISLKLYRRLIPVQAAETAGSGAVALAVTAAAAVPHAVIFPYRFAGAARRYREDHPGITAIILSGRIRESAAEDGPFVYRTATEADFYRAGLCAALLGAGNGSVAPVFQDGSMTQADREAFSSGLAAGGSAARPVYLNSGSDYTAWQNVTCAAAVGPASRLFEQGVTAPVLLFSWIDPAATPRNVKVVFDDSPWALALGAVKAAERGEREASLPSDIVILEERISGDENKVKLKALVKREYNQEGAGR
jgi:hypothetical protein